MLSFNEKRTLCKLQICMTFESIYQLSPASRYNMDLPLPKDAIFPLQMLQAHFENMILDGSRRIGIERYYKVYYWYDNKWKFYVDKRVEEKWN